MNEFRIHIRSTVSGVLLQIYWLMEYNAVRMATENEFRRLPSVDKIISDERIDSLRTEFSHDTVVDITRRYLDELRLLAKSGRQSPDYEQVIDWLATRIQSLGIISPRPVINATGVIIHTNLGRAPLSDEAIMAMRPPSEGYTNLEFDLVNGKRGSRNSHVETLLCQITGAEDALVVNNNASAVLLVLSALCKRKEVIVSRGHAVEIGGKFRIPDVMRQSGAKLVEVGTTNKTYVSDYEEAITDKTAALLRVHSSNFRIVGFTEEVTIEEMIDLGKRRQITVLDDLGSGCLLDTTRFGLSPEPRVQQSVSAGVDLAMFSGDKLLGGPQSGIIVGNRTYMSKLKKHPLARALRIDKTRLAALSATLIHYAKDEAIAKIPVWKMIATPLKEIEQRANKLASQIGLDAWVIEGESTIGGGSLPGGNLPTWLVVVRTNRKIQDVALTLRQQPLPLIGRIEKNAIILDPRTVKPEQDELVLKILRMAL